MAETPASNAAATVSPIVQDQTSPAPHDNVLTGSEAQAQQIVEQNRDPMTDAPQQVAGKGGAFDGMDILDHNTGSDARDLNDIGTASGSPVARNAPTALAPNLGVDRSVIGHTLTKPAAGQTATISVQPGEVLATTFDPNTANLDMHGKDLVMQFNDGSKIVLTAFAADTQDMPSIALPNGALVAGGIIIAQLQGTNDDLFNLETAAGGTGLTSGRFGYSDDFGNVIGLLDKLSPLGFGALAFLPPEPRVVLNDLANFGPNNTPVGNTPGNETTGNFTTTVTSIDGVFGVVSGAFEDWMPHKNDGDMSLSPAALAINFTPQDNEVVDQVTISDIPTGVQFFYGTAGAYAPVAVVGGAVTFTAAQLASGNIFVLDTNKSDADISLNVSLLVRDPSTGQTAVLSQAIVVTVDAVADLPTMTSAVSIDNQTVMSGAINGHEGQEVKLNVNVNFTDNDGSETHTVVLAGVPGEWTLNAVPGMTFTAATNADGSVTYTAVVMGNLNTTLSFDTHEWTSANGPATLTLTARADENATDREITTANNSAQVSTQFVVSIAEDVPAIIAIAPTASIYEHALAVPGNDQVGGDISVQFNTDNPGTLALTLDGLQALNLTSHGEVISYSLAQNGTILIASTVTGVVFTVDLTNAAQNGGAQTFHYEFTLLNPVDHPDGTSADITTVPLHFVATDSDGDTVSGSFNVSIVDDVPVARDDAAVLVNGQSTANGNLLANDTLSVDVANLVTAVTANGVTKTFAADGVSDNGVKYVLVDGQYGQIRVYEDGKYTYNYDNANHSGNLVENFTYTLTDRDGDASTATLQLTINDAVPGAAPHITQTIDETVDIEHSVSGSVAVADATSYALGGLTGGGVGFTASGSLEGGALSSHGSAVTVALVDGHYVGTAADGHAVFDLSINNDGTYSFVQHAALDHADGSNPNDVIGLNFQYVAKDADGDGSAGSITVNVRDDAPVAHDDTNSVPDGNTVATGNLLANDQLSVDTANHVTEVSGANGVVKHFDTDGMNDAGGKYVVVDGQYGQLKVYDDGKYTFTYDSASHGGTTNAADYNFVFGSSDPSVKLYAFAMGVDFQDASGHLLLQNVGQGGAYVAYNNQGAGVSSDADPYGETTYLNGVSEALAIELPSETMRALVKLNSFYSGNDGPDVQSEHGEWLAYDASGKLVATGDITADNTFNVGNGERNFAITTNEAFKYIVFRADIQVDGPGTTPGANTDSNFYIKSVSIPAQDMLEEFKYTLTDKDGDHDAAKLVIGISDSGIGDPVHVAPHIELEANHGAVTVQFDRFNLPENALAFPTLTERQDVEGMTTEQQYKILTDTAEKLTINFSTQVDVKLVMGAGVAGYKTPLGAFTLQDDGTIQNVKLLYGNATTEERVNPTPDLEASYHMTSQTGKVVFFIVQNAGDSLTAMNLSDAQSHAFENGGHYDMAKQADGSLLLTYTDKGGVVTTFGEPVYTSIPVFNGDGQSHAIAGTLGDNSKDAVTYGFEDLTGVAGQSSDRDFNDVVFSVTVQPHAEIALQADHLLKTFSITDDNARTHEIMVEVSQLKSGDTIAFDFTGTGYALSGDHVLQNGVDTGISASIAKTVGGAYDVHLVGDASTTHYEALVKAISFSSASDVLSAIGDRHVDITVTDDHGLSSHASTTYSVSPPTGYDVQLAADDHGGTLVGHQYQDLLVGRAGDDILIGGAGNDILAGGSGHNTLTGGDGSDTFLFLKHETGSNDITDFNHAQNDKLDISDLLAGSKYQPGLSHVDDYVKVDHTTGNVFVDAGGQGHFDNSTHIATINNSATLDSVNVILNNDEGTKTVHTV